MPQFSGSHSKQAKYSSAMKMKAWRFSETSTYLFQTTRRHTLEAHSLCFVSTVSANLLHYSKVTISLKAVTIVELIWLYGACCEERK
jgi:hypothetical protein